MSENKIQSNSEDEEIRKLVLARLSILSSDTVISIGSDGSFNRDELMQHVEQGDEIGKKMEEIDIEWLRSFKQGLEV